VTGSGESKQSWFRRAIAASDPKNLRNPIQQDTRVDWQAEERKVAWDPWEVWLKRINEPRRQSNR
jgi:hypothetical protein